MIDAFRCSCAALLVSLALPACGSSSADPPGNTGGASATTGGSAGSLSGASTGGASAGGTANAGAGAAGSLVGAGSGGTSGAAGASGASAGTAGASTGAGGSIAGSGGVGGGAAGNLNYGGSVGYQPWPGGNSVVTVDPIDTYASDLSALQYQAADTGPAVLWAAQNSPSKLYRLLWNGTTWASDTANGWSSGKTLRFANGSGAPDSEGVTRTDTGALYASIERDNDDGNVSRLSVLQYDATTAGSTLNALREWNLTSDLPKTGSNLGLEAIAWAPDTYLVTSGFIDESKKAAYVPANYGEHAGGIFFVGVEGSGMIYGFALDHVNGTFTRVASIASGNDAIMDLSFDRDVGYLYAVCDDTCDGRINVLAIDTRIGSATKGKFIIRRGFERPSSMPNLNNEGFTVTTESTCQAGFKAVFYAEDGSTNGHAIRRDSLPCGAFL
jgi:hypothetical protein